MKKRIIACLVSLILVLTSIPLNASATDEPNLVYLDIGKGTITISAGTILAYAPDGTRIRKYDFTATYVVTGTSNNTNIIVNGGAVTLMFDNCNIDLSSIDDACAVILNANSNLSIGVISDSTIKSGKNAPGIKLKAPAQLNIVEPVTGTSGTLNVYGGENAAAIGVVKTMSAGNGTINIGYGTMNLYGGKNSTALGRSNGSSSVSVSGNNTFVNVHGQLTAIETSSLTVSSGATLNCQSSSDSNAIQADTMSVTDATVNASTPGKGTALYCGTITVKESKINAESYGGTAIGKIKSSSNKAYITVTNSTLTVKSPASAYAIDGYAISITDSEVFVLNGKLRDIPKNAFVYIDKVCTYKPTKPLTFDYTVPDGHTLIIPEGTVVEIGKGGKLRQGNGTLVIEGTLYYPGTIDGTENGDPVLDNYALIEDSNITWYTDISNLLKGIEASTADNIELKLFASAKLPKNLPNKDLIIDLNGFDLAASFDLTIENNNQLKVINSAKKKSVLDFWYGFHNYDTFTVEGNIDVDFEIKNNGGTVNLINTNGGICSTPFYNSDGGIINVDGAYLYGDSGGGYNDEGCTLNITNGGRIVSDLIGITNYGTINADNFTLFSYGTSIINNGGKVTLKNGNFIAYGPSISNTDGYVYAENCTMNSYESGSGINSSGTLYLKDSTISSSQFGLTGVGHSGTLTVENCTISGGYDGLCLYEGTAKITNSSIGGGFYSYNGYGLYNGGEMTVENCDIYGGYGLGNSGTIHLKDTDINNCQGYHESYAIFNSGDLHFENGIINGSISAYIDEGGSAEFKNVSITGCDLSYSYEPEDLYGNESTFYMSNGTVKLFECSLPDGFYVVTDSKSENKYTVKTLIAEKHFLYKADDDSPVELSNDTAMLDGAYYIQSDESKLPDFGASIANINESNVTSDNIDAINSELIIANRYNSEDYSEEIAAKINLTKEKCNVLLSVINSVNDKYVFIIDSASKINASELTSDEIADIEAIITEASSLLSTNNLTADERTNIETARTQLEEIVAELTDRKSAIETAVDMAEEIANSKPTTDDEPKITALIAEIDRLLSLELTEEEKDELAAAKTQLEEIVAELTDRKSAIETAVDMPEEIANSKPTTDDEPKITALIAEIDRLLSLELTEEEKDELAAAKTQLEEIVAELTDRKSAIETAVDMAEEIANSKPTTDDEPKITALIAEIDRLLSLELTEEEKDELAAAKTQLEEIVAELTDRKSAIETAVDMAEEIANSKPTTDDEPKITALIAEIDRLLSLELTEEEKDELAAAKESALSTLENFKEKRNELSELKAEYESIDYKKVNIFDKDYLENLSERISRLIDDGVLGTNDIVQANVLKSNVDKLIELVNTPSFYGLIRIFWTIVSMINAIIH